MHTEKNSSISHQLPNSTSSLAQHSISSNQGGERHQPLSALIPNVEKKQERHHIDPTDSSYHPRIVISSSRMRVKERAQCGTLQAALLP